MLAGVLELQLFAEMARLSTDMKRAERVVQDSTDKMGRNVATLESAFGKLGGTLALGAAFDAVRRLTDDFTKLTAQLRIATHSQAEYAAGLADVRRISTAAQADINATTMLYTRLTNALSQHGATQKQISTITENVSLGLKAYGATATEASSAMLQLSQAFGANRLGGEEFRAVSESMPNMMKILAQSMNVPYEALKKLSAEGAITAEVMMKAWDNPAIIESLRKQADMTRTITGEMTVFRSNLKMLVGQLMETSDSTRTISGGLQMMSESLKFLEQNLSTVLSILTAYVGYLALLGAKSVIAWGRARLVAMAHTQALVADAVGKAAHARAVVLAEAQEAAALQLKTFANQEAFIATRAATQASLAGALAAEERAAMELRLAGAVNAVNIAHAEAIIIDRELTATRFAGTAAEKARAAALYASSAAAIRWGTSVSAAMAMVATSVSAALLANPIGAAVLAIVAIGVAIVNWETIVKASKATFDWFGNMIDALVWGAHAASIKLGQFFGKLALGSELAKNQITPAKYRELLAALNAETEKALVDQAKIGQDTRTYEEKMAAEQYANDRKAWEKLTNNKAQQRAAEIEELKEHYRALVKGQVLSKEQIMDNEERYASKLADINEKYGKAAAKVAKKTHDEAMKHAEELAKIQLSIDAASARAVDSMIKETEVLQKKIDQEKYETSILGKTKEQIALLEAARYDNTTAILEETLALNDAFGVNTQEIEQLRKQIALRKELKQTMVAQAAGQAAHAAIEAERAANKQLWKDIDGFAHTAFDNIFDKGKNAFEELGKVIKKTILDMLYRMTIQRWLIPVSVTGGVGVSGSATAAGGDGGAGSWLNTGFNLLNSSLESFSASFTELAGSISGGLQSLGVASDTAGTIGVGGAYIGAGLAGIALGSMIAGDKVVIGLDGKSTAAIGAAIGLAVSGGNPLGAVVGGAIGGLANAMFGSGPKESGTTTLAGSFGKAGFTGAYQTPWTQSGGWFSGGDSGTDVTALAATQARAFNNLVAGTASVFGKLAFVSGVATKSLDAWTFSINRQITTQEQQNQLVIDLANSMGTHLIPRLSQFKKEGENLADTAVRLTDEVILLDKLFYALGSTTKATIDSADALANALGGVANASQAMTAFITTFAPAARQTELTLEALTNAGLPIAKLLTTTEAWWEFAQTASAEELTAILKNQGAIKSWIGMMGQASSAINESMKALQDNISSLKAFGVSVRDLMRTLWLGAQSPLASTYAASLAEFLRTNTLAAGGDVLAQKDLGKSATAFLDAARLQAVSAVGYARDFALVQNELGMTAYSTDLAITVADSQLAELKQVNVWLASIDAKDRAAAETAQRVAAEQARLGTLVQSQANIITSVGTGIEGIGQLAVKYGLSLQGAGGAAASFDVVNGIFVSDYEAIAGQTQNFAPFKSEFYAAGGVFDQTYGQAGALTATAAAIEEQRDIIRALGGIPAFATGINAGILSGDTLLQAHGGEEIKPAAYVDLERAARRETNALLSRLVASNDASRGELRAAREELADIRRTNQNIDWTTDKWDNEGIPSTRLVA